MSTAFLFSCNPLAAQLIINVHKAAPYLFTHVFISSTYVSLSLLRPPWPVVPPNTTAREWSILVKVWLDIGGGLSPLVIWTNHSSLERENRNLWRTKQHYTKWMDGGGQLHTICIFVIFLIDCVLIVYILVLSRLKECIGGICPLCTQETVIFSTHVVCTIYVLLCSCITHVRCSLSHCILWPFESKLTLVFWCSLNSLSL